MNDNGFTLIELMVATFLSVLLVLGLSEIYLFMQSSFRFQKALSEIQERGRFLSAILSQRIHRAGDLSCEKHQGALTKVSPIMAYVYDQAPSKLKRQMISGTEVLIVNGCLFYQQRKQWGMI